MSTVMTKLIALRTVDAQHLERVRVAEMPEVDRDKATYALEQRIEALDQVIVWVVEEQRKASLLRSKHVVAIAARRRFDAS